MSDTYNAPEPESRTEGNVTVNVTAPASPAAPAPIATQEMVNAFLSQPAPGAPAATTRSGATTYHEPAERHNIIWGLGKGMERPILGALSLLPGIGQYFTRESWLGQRAYAPSEGIGENIGVAIGEFAPWVAGGEALAGTQIGARALGSIYDFSPTLARAIGSAYGGGTIRGAGGRMASRFRSAPAVAKRAAVAGGVAGATQQPEGRPDASWLERVGERVAPAAAGAVTGGALGIAGPALQRSAAALGPAIAGLSTSHQGVVNNAVTALGTIATYGASGNLPLTILAMYALHQGGLGVRAAHQLAPLVAQQAIRLGANSARGAAAAGAVAGAVVNDIGRP